MVYKCCVVGCMNNRTNSNCNFFKFPVDSGYKIEQRNKWIAAVRKVNNSHIGTVWNPKPTDVICSDHFVGKKKSYEQTSPGYVPTIFSGHHKKQIDETAAINRHERFMKRWRTKKINKGFSCNASIANHHSPSVQNLQTIPGELDYENNYLFHENVRDIEPEKLVRDLTAQYNMKVDQASQAEIFFQPDNYGKTFVCNRYFYHDYCDAETQTEINEPKGIIRFRNNVKFVDTACGSDEKMEEFMVDKEINTEVKYVEKKSFKGIESIEKDEELIDIAGVTLENFNLFLKLVNDVSDHRAICKENRLLIFLVKMKTGLTFSSIGVFFKIHRTTVSNIFYSILYQIADATKNDIYWPDKFVVQRTMPQCFLPEYKNTRVIIDCTEFKIQVPSSVDDRVFCYSHYKKGFTVKVLVGATPGGLICFKSKIAGGRKSDTNITVESSLLELLEDGDEVMADRGFPEIKNTISDSGKKVIVVYPPFLKGRRELSKEEAAETYSIARVRIHIERIMQRLRLYKILSFIPQHLLHAIDDIFHVACVLVNLQPPIIAVDNDKNNQENNNGYEGFT